MNNLYLKYKKLIYRFANKYAFCFAEEVEDLAQVGSIGLLKAFNSYSNDKGKFIIWATIYIKGEILKYLRKKHKLRVKNKVEIFFCDQVPEKKIINNDIWLFIELTLLIDKAKLSKLEKQIIDLYYFQDLEEKTISKLINVNIKRIHRIKRYAVSKLRKYLNLKVKLTKREREISQLAKNLTNKEIANQLNIKPRTVDSYLVSIYRKLNINCRKELI